ncbi:MAG: ShlB/FhaC/HecB family hemolysin secretion/activation protein [Syntrophaceae bacterium]
MLPVSSASGQVLPSFDPTGRSGDRRPELLEEKPPAPPPTVTAPLPPVPAKEPQESLLKTVFVRKIDVTGYTVFSAEEISKITAPYENRNVTMEDLESLRRALTLLYVNKGYVNSGAVVPDQKVVDGVITVKIIEGKLTHIDVEGNKWFGETFLKDRIALGAGPPVNVSPLQDRLQLLQQDQRIERIHAELRPGTKPGESELKVKVEEKPPFYAWLAVNNYQHPSVGAVRGLLTLAHQNLTGHADILSFTYGRSEGLNPMIDAWYVVPLTVYDTTVLLRYRKNDFDVVTHELESLDIENKSQFYEITLRQPVYRTLNQEFALSVSLEYEQSETYLLGEHFSFYPGVEDGKSVVIPLRFTQEWTYRTQKQVFALRSRFTFGLDTGAATIHNDGQPDGKFVAWLGQFQWARVLDFLDTQLLFRADIQRSDDSLLPLEQLSVGGRYSVRGYRENLLVRDQAFIASLEARIPLIQHMRWADYIQICPFYDYGRGTFKFMSSSGPDDISSVGVGLRWAASLIKSPLNLRAEFEMYWGYALRDIDLPYEDVQDDGIHYQFAITGSF